jgi:hypothetical protein
MKKKLDPELAVEAKALVALAFRNGPIEDLHAGSHARFAAAIGRSPTSPMKR